MHRSIQSAILVTFAALTVAAVPASRPTSADLQFVDRMSARLTRALELARTADATAQLPALKSFAHAQITEREDQLNDLAEMRSRLGGGTAESPSGSTTASAPGGNGSDRGMIDAFIRQNRETIQLARTQPASGNDAELSAFARRLTYSETANTPELQQMRDAIVAASGQK